MAEQDNFIGQAAGLDNPQAPSVYKEPSINPFDAPVPGQSLTDTPGNYGWEHPPQFADIEGAAEYVYNRLQKKENTMKRKLLDKEILTIKDALNLFQADNNKALITTI